MRGLTNSRILSSATLTSTICAPPSSKSSPMAMAKPEASDRDAMEGWTQALTLHRRQRTLHKDLKDAEAALALEPSEANLARLVDIQTQMASTEGTEALIEGFGSAGAVKRVL